MVSLKVVAHIAPEHHALGGSLTSRTVRSRALMVRHRWLTPAMYRPSARMAAGRESASRLAVVAGIGPRAADISKFL